MIAAGFPPAALLLGGAGAIAASTGMSGPVPQGPSTTDGPDIPGVPDLPEPGDTPDAADAPDVPGVSDSPEPGDTPDAPATALPTL